MKLFTERNFLIRSVKDGRIYGHARSIWAMINTETRQPADLLTLNDGAILRYVIPAEEKTCPIARHGRLPRLSGEPVRSIPTYYSDVDINGHINSIKYIEHVLDLFPREQFELHRVRRFEIAYKAESYLGDTLTFFMEETDGEHHVDIRKHVGSPEKPAGETIVQAKVCWVARDGKAGKRD